MRARQIAIGLMATMALALAQSDRGSITGTIFDRLGRIVLNAPVEVRNADTGAKFVAETDGKGEYTISLPRGTYVLSIEVAGIKYMQPSMVIIPEHPLRHDVTLALP